jgi:heat shock protein HslJ
MRNLSILAGCALMLLCSQCDSASKKISSSASGDQHNSSNSLDWEGSYYGVTPCADCPGIATIVWLNKDMTYRVVTRYMERQKDSTEYTGRFSWNDSGSVVSLEGAGKDAFPGGFLVGENTLTLLNKEGQKVTGDLAINYVLSKDNYGLLGKDWLLVELNGKPLDIDSTSGKTPHITFYEADGRFSGNGGCNGLSGAFELKGMNRISFVRVIRTQMACPALETENEFIKVLETADNFNVSDTSLVLNRARMAPLARLRAVKSE